jgi:excinuclease ABC subunit A
MSLPRELRIRDGRLIQNPIRELEAMHGRRVFYENVPVRAETVLRGVYGRVLDMTVTEALDYFKNQKRIEDKLQVLEDVGLGYIRLGQAATTLSGGEAQRIKLAAELSKKGTGRTMYILDEPTTGLHTADVHKLLQVLQRLVDSGNTVVVIEHNLDVIKSADWLIDLGPEGGDKGGTIVGVGTPEQLARNKNSYTGQYLKRVIDDAKKSGKYQ